MTGKQIRSLMRKHRKTIRGLSAEFGLTQKRIRQVREIGVDNAGYVRDWVQIITGVDPGTTSNELEQGHDD